MDDLDLRGLGDIPDPFARAARTSPRPPGDPPPSSPSRAQVRGLRVAAVAIALLAQGVWLALVEHRSDIAASSVTGLLFGLGIPLVAAAVALAAATRRGALGLGESATRLAALVGLSVAVFVVGTMVAAPQALTSGGEAGVTPSSVEFWDHARRCMAVTAALAALPLALGLMSFRHAFVAAARWRSAALGAAAGGLAAATMSLACSDGSAAHVLVGHGAMMLVGAAIGAALGGATRA
jgi:hypothetical protein